MVCTHDLEATTGIRVSIRDELQVSQPGGSSGHTALWELSRDHTMTATVFVQRLRSRNEAVPTMFSFLYFQIDGST